MLRKIACLALAASALAGCIVVAKPAGTVEVYGQHEPHGHAYIYFPGYHAYYCTAHDDWWWIDGGRWTYVRTRPSHIHVDVNVAWVHVDDDDGPEPYRRYDDHSRNYPRDWRPVRYAGPPPGRAGGQPAENGPGNRGRGNAYGHDRDADPGEGADRGQGREGGHEGGPPADGDRDASEKGASPPKEKAGDKKRGRDKDKDKSQGKGGEGDESRGKKSGEKDEKEKDKDVEKEQDSPEKKEQGGDEEEKKGRGPKKRGD